MSEHPINDMMGNVMQKVKEMVDVNTIIGNPITTPDGTTIIPVSKVTFGFASGGGDYPKATAQNRESFGGGGGAGVTIKPIAFLTVSGGNVRLIQIDENPNSIDKLVTSVPDVIDKIGAMIDKGKENAKSRQEEKSDA